MFFRGGCNFIIYISSKSDKYSLKIVVINISVTHYLLDVIPYCGTLTREQKETVPSYYVRGLTKNMYNLGRNVTCDNWFTSMEICDKLRNDYGWTLVGTIHKNKYEIS